MHHHGLVLSGPLGPDQSHKVQEVSGVIGDAVVRPGQVLDLSELPLLLSLGNAGWENIIIIIIIMIIIIIIIISTWQMMAKTLHILRYSTRWFFFHVFD